MTDPRRTAIRLLLVLAAVDLALFTVNLLGAPSFLRLDEEQNLPTWLSSTKLLGAALLAAWCARADPRRCAARLTWPALSLLFAALSLDETATAHERLAALVMSGDRGISLRARLLGGDPAKDAFAWPVLFAPVIVALVYFLATSLWSRLREDRSALLLGLGGCALFVAAVALEGPAVWLSPPIDSWGAAEIARYDLFVLLEEGSELAATTLMLGALALHAARLAARESRDLPG